jgi:hypothetical protein
MLEDIASPIRPNGITRGQLNHLSATLAANLSANQSIYANTVPIAKMNGVIPNGRLPSQIHGLPSSNGNTLELIKKVIQGFKVSLPLFRLK